MSVFSKEWLEKQHSSDYRLSAITHYKKSGSFTDTCRVFDCKRQTLKDKEAVKKIYKRNSTLRRKHKVYYNT